MIRWFIALVCFVGLQLQWNPCIAGQGAESIEKRLQKPMDWPGLDSNTPLQDALEFFDARTGIQVLLDRDKLGCTGAAPVKMPKMTGVSRRLVVRLMLSQAGLQYEAQGEKLCAIPARFTKRGLPATTELEKEYWKKTQEKLLRKTNLDGGIDPKTQLQDALLFLSQRYDLPIVLDVGEFDRADKKGIQQAHVQLPVLKNVTLYEVIVKLVRQVGAEFENTDGAVLIVPIPAGRGTEREKEERK